MKAKEYAEMYAGADDKQDILGKIFASMWGDLNDTFKIRNISTLHGMKSVVKEADNKWKAFVRIVNEKHEACLREDGFQLLSIKRSPSMEALFR